MKILILGGGGREHALAWKIAQSPLCDRLIVAPGNAGIQAIAETPALDILDPAAVVAYAKEQKIDFVVVGPEAPLAAGVVDALTKARIAAFGPSQAAAELEASKTFTKTLCSRHKIPTAAWASFDTADAAKIHVMVSGAPIVVKADGLAAGKGVTVAATVGDAMAAIDEIFAGHQPGQPAPKVVIEEAMTGEEVSLFILTDGDAVVSLGGAQDYKRVAEGDKGPNTGGMGAYAPAPILDAALEKTAIDSIIRPTLRAMAGAGTPFRGVLYPGLMLVPGAAGEPPTPKLVEFNTRFGDPETQPLMMRLESDLVPLLLACSEPVGAAKNLRAPLARQSVAWRDGAAVTVVMAAAGYPGAYKKGEVIGGLPEAAAMADVAMFHAGTAAERGQVLSNGGRVLNATATGPDFATARGRAYEALRAIDWSGGFYRRDIAVRAVEAEKAATARAEAAAEIARREAEHEAALDAARRAAAAQEAAPVAAITAPEPAPPPSAPISTKPISSEPISSEPPPAPAAESLAPPRAEPETASKPAAPGKPPSPATKPAATNTGIVIPDDAD